MTQLHSCDFFQQAEESVAIEPRHPQGQFPEHDHDFSEIVIVEHGTGTHIFNGQPYTLSGGSVCFVRDHDRHLYEYTDNLCLTNVLYRSADEFNFLSGLNRLLPQEQDGYYPSHWRINQNALQQVCQLAEQLERLGDCHDIHATANKEVLFMQLLMLLYKNSIAAETSDNEGRMGLLLSWLEDHFAEKICWDSLADHFSLSLRTLHRQLKQQTGLTPQRYLNRLRLSKAHHLLRHSEESVTDVAFLCGFGDSNHFSTLFKREFQLAPRDFRQQWNRTLQ